MWARQSDWLSSTAKPKQLLFNWGQIPIVLALKTGLSSPPWGLIFLVFRSKNGPHAVLFSESR